MSHLNEGSGSALLGTLKQIVDPGTELGRSSAVRLRARLQPAGGAGAKLMPPTYAGDDGPVYVRERRVIEGERFDCVSLDSVASQANRMEEYLLEEIEDGRAEVPTIWVDQGKFGVHTALGFPHRSFDAWIEDAYLDGQRFGDTELWETLASSKRRDLTALMEHSPASVILGSWASRSKNPQGTARLPRILASEIIAVDAEEGARAASRIDVHQISASIPTYAAADGDRFVLDEERAAQDEKGKPILAGAGEKRGKPSALGYGNVTPQLASHGGITAGYALQIATISLPAIRECRFPIEGERDRDRDVSGRALLLALALRMLALQVERGYDLRSGCLLVPEEEPTFELLDPIAKTTASWPVLGADTAALLDAAVEGARERGIRWETPGLRLKASDVQLELLERSLAEAPAEGDGE
jgi:CRISPR-associated protein Csb1